jgi:hypothetical protein
LRVENSEAVNQSSDIAYRPHLHSPAPNHDLLSKSGGVRDLLSKSVQVSSIVSSGAACRLQIRQGTGVEAIHPILLIANLLKDVSK